MVRGESSTAYQSGNLAQSKILTHGQKSKGRHHNQCQKVRWGNIQQEPLGDTKTNVWPASETKDIEDKEEESDDSEK
jgi:hypothetical protein